MVASFPFWLQMVGSGCSTLAVLAALGDIAVVIFTHGGHGFKLIAAEKRRVPAPKEED